MNRLLFIFLDGVGMGEAVETNPFYVVRGAFLPFYRGGGALPDGTPVKAIDPVLGVEGLPQSASGQTTLYTGENIPALLNTHRGSYPNKIMRKIIREKNILSRLRAKGLEAGFINAYPFFSKLFTQDHVSIGKEGAFQFSEAFPLLFRRRISVTTCMMIVNGLQPYGARDIAAERAIYQEYGNLSLIKQMKAPERSKRWDHVMEDRDVRLTEFSPEKAAAILADAFTRYNFLLYEYFQTDIYGHRHAFGERVKLIRRLDRLIGTVISQLDASRDTLLITSDHGNLEDATTKSHTRNPVPLIVWGREADGLRERIEDLTDVTPAIEDFLKGS